MRHAVRAVLRVPCCLTTITPLFLLRRPYSAATAAAMPKVARRGTTGPPKPPSVPAPSASVVVLSPTNEILLLHRLQTSSSFSSAHVFPGGNVSAFHEGDALSTTAPDHPARHADGPAYRLAAIRETFEESGVLLAKKRASSELLSLSADASWAARQQVADEQVAFGSWLEGVGGEPDVDNLIPFTHWITPVTMPRRYTTQMYLYLLPLDATLPTSHETTPAAATAATATPDQSEVMAAEFASAAEWVRRAQQGDVILFPPQMYILSLLAPILASTPGRYAAERAHLQTLLQSEDWAGRAISPRVVGRMPPPDGRTVMALDFPGEELRASGRRGDSDRVVLVGNLPPGPPRRIELRPRTEVMPVVEAAKREKAKAGDKAAKI